ncbi:MAG: RnfABCDGE type electron transport complex subunit B [Candidatus Aureabacteria bacterium]|nr:RnfABCDGE type electron transport complex subunit B [Candidatus Auribacterota bacterium]
MQEITVYSLTVLGAMGLILGLVLAFFGRIFSVTVDPRIEEVAGALAGLNCGVCGYPGCRAMAEALVAGKARARQCTPGGAEVVKKVSAILGTAEQPAEPRVAAVRCRGGREAAIEKAEYRGVPDCVSAELLGAGPKACVWGCLGMGSCVRVCPFDAIHMSADRLPEIDENGCTGCGKCAVVCPRHIIALIPRSQRVYLGCISGEKGKRVKEVCAVGCTACGLCAQPKITPSGRVLLKDNLPEFPPDWSDFATAAEKCPSRCFVVRLN